MASPTCLRFAPSKVEGLPDVTEVAVFPDRLEFISAGKQVVFWFADIAQWPRPAWLSRRLFRWGWRPKWLPVADRDWFHPPPKRFFRFYTHPPIVVCMPVCEHPQRAHSTFLGVQMVLGSGGFHTFDLG